MPFPHNKCLDVYPHESHEYGENRTWNDDTQSQRSVVWRIIKVGFRAIRRLASWKTKEKVFKG